MWIPVLLSSSVVSADFWYRAGCDVAVHVCWSHMCITVTWTLSQGDELQNAKILYHTLNRTSPHFAVLTIPWLLMHMFHGKCSATWQTPAFSDIVILASLPIYQAKISCTWLFPNLVHSLHLAPFTLVPYRLSINKYFLAYKKGVITNVSTWGKSIDPVIQLSPIIVEERAVAGPWGWTHETTCLQEGLSTRYTTSLYYNYK